MAEEAQITLAADCTAWGVKLEWMTPEAKDLGGQKRVFNAKPDLGCYESQVGGTVIIVR